MSTSDVLCVVAGKGRAVSTVLKNLMNGKLMIEDLQKALC